MPPQIMGPGTRMSIQEISDQTKFDLHSKNCKSNRNTQQQNLVTMLNKGTGIENDLLSPPDDELNIDIHHKMKNTSEQVISIKEDSQTMHNTQEIYSTYNDDKSRQQELIEIKSKSILNRESELANNPAETMDWEVSPANAQLPQQTSPTFNSTERTQEIMIDTLRQHDVVQVQPSHPGHEVSMAHESFQVQRKVSPTNFSGMKIYNHISNIMENDQKIRAINQSQLIEGQKDLGERSHSKIEVRSQVDEFGEDGGQRAHTTTPTPSSQRRTQQLREASVATGNSKLRDRAPYISKEAELHIQFRSTSFPNRINPVLPQS